LAPESRIAPAPYEIDHPPGFSRFALLRRGGLALVAGSGLAALAGAASAATLPLPDGDLSYLRLLIGAELLEADFEAQALASGKLGPRPAAIVRQMAADEKAHYSSLAQLQSLGGQTPATADDIDFSYPKGSFDTEGAILKLAASIEAVVVGAYMGAIQNLATPQVRLAVGQIAGNEAQHVGALAALAGKPVIGRAFTPSLQIDAVSTFLDGFES
jgi:hypothetical protein